MKIIQIQAGHATKILSKFSNSIPTTYSFSASTASGDTVPSGSVEISGSNWIFPKASTLQPLKAKNTVTKTMWDVFFSVYITPDQDVTIELEGGQINKPLLFIALIVGIVAVATVFLIAGLPDGS